MVHYDVNTDDDGNETIAVQKVTPWEDENDGYDPEWWTDKSSDLSLLLIAGGLSGFLLNRSVEWSHPGVIIMFGLAILLGLPKIILLLYQNS